ncbi:MAG: DUF1549 domain-containing protein, partial [Bacteroidetes bacterium]|nr:DUF1549 domain-containing protein [Bacteroidota bacterium]
MPDLPRKVKRNGPTEVIDYLIDKKIKDQGMVSAQSADKSALIRRLSYLTTGLPPAPEKMEAFVADSSEKAWENLVDEYLASPHFGERWARHWMDLVRYAETMGHEFDYGVSDAWAYRDYLIRAFNQDVPYDLLVKEHLAGDMLENPRFDPVSGANESVIGTAYAYMGEGKHSPVSIKQEEADRIDNMIDVTSKAFMGMTVGCARCHDHKFDPIPTTDYYAMYGMFESSRFSPVSIDLTPQKQENINEIERLNEELRIHLGKQWEKDLLANQPIAQKVQLVNNEIPAKKEISANYNLIADFRCETEVSLREKGWEAQGNFIHDGLKVNGEEIRLNPRKLRLEAYSVGKAEVLRSPNFIIEDDFYEFRAAGNRGTVRLIIDNFQLIQDPIYGDIQKTIYNPEMDFYRMNVKMWKGHKAYFEFIPGGFKQHVYEVN